MSIDRTIQPPAVDISSPIIPFYETILLANGLPVHTISDETAEAVKVSLFFNAGLKSTAMPFLASTAASVWQQGTAKYSSLAFSTAIDSYGAYLSVTPAYEFTEITIHTLAKYFIPVMDLVMEMILQPAFRESDIQVDTKNRKQRLITELKKTSFTAMSNFNKLCYGGLHPLGYTANPADAENIHRLHVLDFYEKKLANAIFSVMISGKIGSNMVHWMELNLSKLPLDHTAKVEGPPSSPEGANYLFNLHPEANQSSLVMGKSLFSRLHPDFPKMRLLITLFGGYFGSRLMTNIREEKGYTYGISAYMNLYLNCGQFVIRTDVGTEVSAMAVKEIRHELQRLLDEEIPKQELDLVRNYMLGTYLRSMDGALAQSEIWSRLLNYGLGPEALEANLDAVRFTTAAELQRLANQYLQPNSMQLTVSGSLDIGI